MRKKILCAILSMLMLLPLASCSSSTENADEDTGASEVSETPAVEEVVVEEEEDTTVMDDLEDADLGGADYIIAGLSSRSTTAVTASELTGEVVNDAQYTAARAVEDRFNVTVSYEDIANSDSDMSTAIKGLVNGGDDTYAVAFGRDGDHISLAVAGYFHNLKTVDQFNFDMPWWLDSTEQISIGDKSYVASSYLSYYCLYYVRVFVINKTIANNLGIEIPYQKVYEGNWYLDDMTAMCEAATIDTNGDGTMDDNDQYGLSYEVLYTLQNSLGIEVVSKDENNIPYLNLDVDRAGVYLEKMWNIIDNYAYYESGYGATFFSNAKSLMCYCNLREVCNVIRDTDLDYGFLPAPKLDENQTEFKTVATDIYWGIPASQDAKLDMIGTVTEALSCQHFNLVRPAFFETTMKSKLSGSEDDTKMLDIVASNISIDFGYAYNSNLGSITSFDDMINDNVYADTIASTYQKMSKSMQKALDKLIEKYNELT